MDYYQSLIAKRTENDIKLNELSKKYSLGKGTSRRFTRKDKDIIWTLREENRALTKRISAIAKTRIERNLA